VIYIEPVALIHEVQLPVIVFSLEIPLSHGNLRNKTQSLALL
jgi:hypothetical protein